MLTLTSLVGMGAGSSSSSKTLMEALTDESLNGNTILCLDFSSTSCYSGTGQTVSDLSGNGNDFWLGSSTSTESTDPTFNAQGALSYFSFDGGDFMQIKTVPAALKGFHKNNATFSVVWVWRPVNGSADQTALSTLSSGFTHGVRVGVDSSEAFGLLARTASGNAIVEAGALSVTPGSDHFCALALDEAAGGTGSHWRLDGSTDTFDGTYTSPSSTDSTIVRIGANGSGGDFMASGARLYAIAALDTDISTTNSGNLYSALQSRFGF